MKTSFNWLKQYVDIDISPKELCDKMVMAGFEVEEITDLSETMKNVVAGKIVDIKKHEDSDHLQICMLDIGKEENLQIVTGADNIFVGATVPVALDNSLLPTGVKIKKGKLRGVDSFGMMCSGEELLLKESDYKGAEVHGILILDSSVAAGTDMREILNLFDYIIDFKITANRPDCSSIIGIAREAAAVLNKPFKAPKIDFKEVGDNIKNYLTVENQNYDICPRYMGKVVKNIRIKESPEWLKTVLKASGMRPINNIVDITNFVMLETGQPMHAFDLRELEDNKIIVRNAKKGEKIVLLDEKEVELKENMLVIADGVKPSCLAGVMGGMGSGIKPDTKEVFFECAKFKRDSIRKTAKAVGVRTESSARYEKGTDICNVEYALKRALHLICSLDAGDVVCGAYDLNKGFVTERKLDTSVSKINALLGLNIPGKKQEEILNSLLIKTTLKGDTLHCIIPSFRDDIEFTADIAEEVIRLYGCDHIEGTVLKGEQQQGKRLPKIEKRRALKLHLAGIGLNEIYTYSFIPKKEAEKLGLSNKNLIEILNPLGEEFSVMRTQLVSSMLNVLSTNMNKGNENCAFFELSKRFIAKEIPLKEQPQELTTLCIGAFGETDFYKIKGYVESVFEFLGVNPECVACSNIPYLHPGRTAEFTLNGERVAILGEVHPKTMESFSINKRTFIAEIYLENLEALNKKLVIFKPLPKFPAVNRDLALICSEDLNIGDMEKAIKKGAGKLLENLKLFDVYKGNQIEKGKKSVAFGLTLRSHEDTLTDEQIEQAINKALKELEKIGAVLRS